MALNIITNNTKYISFDVAIGNTFSIDVIKTAISSIECNPNSTNEVGTGEVTITTITQPGRFLKDNGIITLYPSRWAVSTAPTVPFTNAAAIRAALLAML